MKGFKIMVNEKNERIAEALRWAKERNVGSKRLNIFDRDYIKRLKAEKKKLKKGIDNVEVTNNRRDRGDRQDKKNL
ncbi:unnamed protein product [marine sediment metagenome]|uniref:Uncharacterized protein n=1 Tax=marine sediment metagenome TaxID=412755 RepID=X1G0Q3_9ZZZZ